MSQVLLSYFQRSLERLDLDQEFRAAAREFVSPLFQPVNPKDPAQAWFDKVGARDRTDLILQDGTRQAVIELKLAHNGGVQENLLQLRQYLSKLPNHRGILLRLDQGKIQPAQSLSEYWDGEELVFELHVNRPSASQAGKA